MRLKDCHECGWTDKDMTSDSREHDDIQRLVGILRTAIAKATEPSK